MDFEDKRLGIRMVSGCLQVRTGPYTWQEVEELSLAKLEKVYKGWQALTPNLDKPLGDLLLGQKTIRSRILKLLRDFGFKDPSALSVSQIEALLFFYTNEEGKTGVSLLWQFHSMFPVAIIPRDPDEPEIDYAKLLPDLNIFETARLYLFQENQMDLVNQLPLSTIMKLVLSKGFLGWAADPDNKQKLVDQQNRAKVESEPLDLSIVEDMLANGG